MAIHFQPLLKTMEQKQITWYWLAQQGIDNRTIHRIKHNANITTNTLNKLCCLLSCTPNDIIGYEPDSGK